MCRKGFHFLSLTPKPEKTVILMKPDCRLEILLRCLVKRKEKEKKKKKRTIITTVIDVH